MNEPRTGSKRQALRFAGCNHTVFFKTEFEEGRGIIADISGGGCAISEASPVLALNQKILLSLDLQDADDVVEISARVVRVDGGNTAVSFTHLSDEDRQRIVKFFAEKQRSA